MRRTPGLVVAFSAALAAASTLAPGATAAPAQVSGYVVVLEDGAGPPAAVAERLADRYGGEVGFVYSHALRGFSIRTTDRAAAALASNPKVDYVEADGVMSVIAEDPPQTTPTGIERIFADDNAEIGINGSDERVHVDVAVIDTGIDLEHPDLYVVGSTNCTNESGGPWWNRTVTCADGGGDDDHYHGTHVAGTVAALDNGIGVVGVAPGARLWAVKVLKSNGSGSNSMVIAGIDWVVKQGGIEVANMSLGGSKAQAVNDAVKNAVDKGVSMVVAAGNSAADVKDYSPASEPTAITVSALADFDGELGGLGSPGCRTDVDDTFADFSNYGTGVDIIAPGVCILSTYPLEQGSYGTISGTSMASPHVAGAVALLRSMGKGVGTAEADLKKPNNTNWNDVDDPDSVKEPLLDVSSTTLFKPTLVSGGGGTDPNSVPTASFTHDCTDLTCTFTDTSIDSDGTIASRSWSFGDGMTSTGQNPNHTYAAGGTYTVTLTVTDDGGAEGTTSQQVTVTAPDDGGGTTSPTLSGSSTNNGSTWTATVTVTGTAGTLYAGTWENGTGAQCTTSGAGTCSFQRAGIRKNIGSVTWTHTETGKSVTISKP